MQALSARVAISEQTPGGLSALQVIFVGYGEKEGGEVTMLTGPMTARRSNAKTAYGLMSDIAAYILEEPKRVWMRDWLIRGEAEIYDTLTTKGPACGTVGCIAGNALMLTTGGKVSSSVFVSAMEMLSSDDEDLGADLSSLFLDIEVDANYGTKKYARIVANRIADFQAEHSAELRAVKIAPGPKGNG